MYYIYKITNIKNGKLYFGQTKNFKVRKYTHLNALKRNAHHNPHLQSAFNKYGVEAFKFEIIEKCSIDTVDEREIYYIDKFNTLDNKYGYNYQSGGNLNKIISKETRKKLSESKKGEKNHFYGKNHSIESKMMMRDAKIGSELSNSHKMLISKSSNKTGFFRVYKTKRDDAHQGFTWAYGYFDENNKRKVIRSVDLLSLKDKVVENGLEWAVIDEEKAKISFEENKLNIKETEEYLILNRKMDMETKVKISSNTSETGFFRVNIETDKRYNQGFRWKYGYYDENNKRKRLSSTNLIKLKHKVVNKKLDWLIVDEEKAMESIYLNNSLFDLNLSLWDYR